MSPDTLPIVQLRDGSGELEASFVPSAGMVCSSLRFRGEELLAQGEGVAAYARLGRTMGIPLLYPWANRLAGFHYVAAGRDVRIPQDSTVVAVDDNGLPIHGIVPRWLAWELDESRDEGAATVCARLRWDESSAEHFDVFPYRHDVCYRARLDEGRLQIELTVEASSTDAVPLTFGFHPYLSIPGVPRERWLVELPAMRHLLLDDRQIPNGAVKAEPAERFELGLREFDDEFDEIAEPARFSVAGGDLRLELDLIEGYACAQVFAPASGPFICFEPMAALTNALLGGAGTHVLQPGSRHHAAFAVRVTRLD